MRRLALPLLALLLLFLAAPFADPCDAAEGDCQPGCHFACLDGCSVAPVETSAPAPSGLEPAGEPGVEPVSTPLERDTPPDLIPPRA